MTLVPLLFALVTSQQAGSVDNHAVILEQVERRYSAYAKACLRKDWTAIENYLTFDVEWTEPVSKDKKNTLRRDEVIQHVVEWVQTLDPKGNLRFHLNRMHVVSDDEVETEVEMQYAPENAPFPPKLKKEDRTIYKEDLVKVSERWLMRRCERISPKPTT